MVAGLLITFGLDTALAFRAPGVDGAAISAVTAHRPARLTSVVRVVTDAGSPAAMTTLAVLLIVVLLLCRRWTTAAWVAVTAIVGGALSPLLKAAFHRPRPVGERLSAANGWSFPSGHTLGTTVVVGLLTLVLTRELCRTGHRLGARLSAAAAVLVAALVGFSRVWLGVHWPTDVLASWLLGALVLTLAQRVRTRLIRPGGRRGAASVPGPEAAT